MMKGTTPILLLFALLFSGSMSAQFICGHDVARRELIKQHPEILIDEAQLSEYTKEYIANNYKGQRSGPFIIPIVFHVIHYGGSENITKAAVLNAVKVLNEDYSKTNPDINLVIPEFQSIRANMEVEFRLAQIDPQGNCTDGIERIYSPQTWMGDDYSKLHNWPREKYLNIWTVAKMRDGVAGYSYYPSSVDALWNVPARDGVIILFTYIANDHALAHEVGHWSNLSHVWGDNNSPGDACGDDDVDDTPITKGWNFCPSPQNSAVCNPPIKENYQNIMEYSFCTRMFTEGQKERVHAALSSTKSQRNNLYTEANLIATGTNDGFVQTCAPIADFCANVRYTCVGNSVKFINTSYNGVATDVLWEFPNGTPSVSTDASPSVVFNTTGWQEVKLTVTNAQGTSTKTDNQKIFVAPTTTFAAPFYENFETPAALNDFGWVSNNLDHNETYFNQVSNAGKSGNHSMMLNNYYTRFNRDIDELISPPFDLSQLSNAQMNLSFYYSLGSWDEDFMNVYDSIVVYATTNCGGTWTKLYNKGGSSIINAGYQSGFYIPGNDQAYWRYVKQNLPATFKQPNVRFKFQVYSSVKTNNFYIDDINIGSAPVGIEDNVLSHFFVQPNPFGNALYLNNLPNGNCSVEMRDVTGRLVLSNDINVSSDVYELDATNVSGNGIYLLTIKSGDAIRTIKVMKQ